MHIDFAGVIDLVDVFELDDRVHQPDWWLHGG